MSSCKVPVISVGFLWNLNFLDIFSKKSQISNFIKIRPVGTELFHADRQTDRRTDMKLIVVFRNFVNVPKKPDTRIHMKNTRHPASHKNHQKKLNPLSNLGTSPCPHSRRFPWPVIGQKHLNSNVTWPDSTNEGTQMPNIYLHLFAQGRICIWVTTDITHTNTPGQLSRYSNWLRTGRSEDRITVGARSSAPIQTGYGAHPASYAIGTGSLSRGKAAEEWRYPRTLIQCRG